MVIAPPSTNFSLTVNRPILWPATSGRCPTGESQATMDADGFLTPVIDSPKASSILAEKPPTLW